MALLLGLDIAVPVLVIQAWVLNLYIVVVSRRQIAWAERIRIVIPAGIGLPFGIRMAQALPETSLKWILAVFMLVVGTHGLGIRWRMRVLEVKRSSSKAKRLASLFLPLGASSTVDSAQADRLS